MTRVAMIVLAMATALAVARGAPGDPTPAPPRPAAAPRPSLTPPPESGAPAPRPKPAPPSVPDTPMATICSTAAGWCPIRSVVAPGTPCECFVPPSAHLDGVARFFPYRGPVSPYLNPHED